MNVDKIAELCSAPYEAACPVVLRSVVSEPEDVFGEADIQVMIKDPVLAQRAGLFRDLQLVDPSEFPEAYTYEGIGEHRRTGGTLVLRGLQRQPGAVRATCQAIAGTGWPAVHAVASETPPHVQGLAAHWDINPVAALQVTGRKTWYVFRPVVGGPEELDTSWSERGFTDEEIQHLTPDHAYETVTLDPGDVYVVPRGWPHYAVGLEDGSLHVSLCPLPQAVFDKYGNEDHRF
jgi:hypothetical protein